MENKKTANEVEKMPAAMYEFYYDKYCELKNEVVGYIVKTKNKLEEAKTFEGKDAVRYFAKMAEYYSLMSESAMKEIELARVEKMIF